MNDGKVSDLVRKYYAAYEAKDRNVIEALLSDEFSFTSPYDDHIDRATYSAIVVLTSKAGDVVERLNAYDRD